MAEGQHDNHESDKSSPGLKMELDFDLNTDEETSPTESDQQRTVHLENNVTTLDLGMGKASKPSESDQLRQNQPESFHKEDDLSLQFEQDEDDAPKPTESSKQRQGLSESHPTGLGADNWLSASSIANSTQPWQSPDGAGKETSTQTISLEASMHSLHSIHSLQLLEEQDPTADGDFLISKESATTGEGGIAGSKEMLEEETNRKQTLENLIAENKFLREQNRRLKEESECKDSKIDELKTVIKDFTCFMKSIDEKLAQVLKNDDSAKALMEENTLLKEQNRLLQEELKSLKKISETHSQEIRELKDQRDDARRVHLVQNQDSQLRNSLARVVNRHGREIETNQINITAVCNTADAAMKRADEAVELGHTNATAVNSAIEGLNEQMMSGAGGLQQNQDG